MGDERRDVAARVDDVWTAASGDADERAPPAHDIERGADHRRAQVIAQRYPVDAGCPEHAGSSRALSSLLLERDQRDAMVSSERQEVTEHLRASERLTDGVIGDVCDVGARSGHVARVTQRWQAR